MFARTLLARRVALLAVLASLAIALPAAAQYVTFPRLGATASLDHHDGFIEIHGDEVFELHILVMPPEGEPTLGHDYQQFEWVLLEPCCGGSATVLDIDYNPALTHEGTLLSGITSTLQDGQECLTGEMIHLATLTLQMDGQTLRGTYFILAGPFGLASDCAGEGVLMTDMQLAVDYFPDITPVEGSTFSDVKRIFR